MKFTGYSLGDASVGINRTVIVIDLVGVDNPTDDDRKYIKEKMAELMDGISDTRFSYCVSEDECEDCGRRTVKEGKCTNPKCINNQPEE